MAEEFDLPNQPPDKRPDMLVSFLGGDALHLDTTLRILLRTGAKPLNFYQYSNPALDKLMDLAVMQPDHRPRWTRIYQKCSKMILDEAVWIPLCIPPNSTIAHTYVTGIEDNSFYPPIFWPQASSGPDRTVATARYVQYGRFAERAGSWFGARRFRRWAPARGSRCGGRSSG